LHVKAGRRKKRKKSDHLKTRKRGLSLREGGGTERILSSWKGGEPFPPKEEAKPHGSLEKR